MGCCILIVDDMFVNRLLLLEILKDYYTECYEAENGKDAIELFSRKSIDLILMDIKMPIMGGIEAAKYIRENFIYPKKDVPIIAITAYDTNTLYNDKDWEACKFDRLIHKPFQNENLRNSVKELCKKIKG